MTVQLQIPLGVEVLAAAIGALAGTIAAKRHGFDMAGMVGMAIVTGLGGGIIRDTLLQQGPPVALTEPWLVVAAAGTGVAASVLPQTMVGLHRRAGIVLVTLDAVFLALYATLGAAKGLDAGLPAVACVLLGVLSAVGGSVLRDILVNEQPELFVPGTLYATPTAIGLVAYVSAVRLGPFDEWSGVGCVALIVALRLVAYWRGWALRPPERDLVRRPALRRRR